MKRFLKCCLLPLSTLLTVSISQAQLPTRDKFNFIFENNYNDNVLGKYQSADFVEDWNQQAGRSPEGIVEIISDDVSHQKAMRAYYPDGTLSPSNSHGFTWYSNLTTGEEIYFSYDIRFKSGFEWVHGGKIPGVIGGSVTSGQPMTSSSGFSARMMWKGGGSLVFYIYHHDQTSIYGDTYFWEGFNFQTNKWYNLTIRVVLNSISSNGASANGILEGYVDGKLMFQKTNFRFRLNSTIKIDRMYICSFFGGNTQDWAATRDEWIDFDNFVAYTYSSNATDVPRGLQRNTSGTLLHPYYNYTGTTTVAPPAAPSALTYTSTNSSSVSLKWNDNCTREDGFRIERKTATGSYTQVGQVASNATSYTNSGLSASTSYTYRVHAYNSGGNSAYSNEYTVSTNSSTTGSNLAAGKPSLQSTTAYSGVASRANDNNTNGAFSSGSVSNTGTNLNPYWQVDMQGSYSLTNIEIWNRTDACCIARMNNFYVFVSDNPFTSTDPLTTKNQTGVWSNYQSGYPDPSISIPVNRTGRYVRIQLDGQNELAIAEVKVFGSSAPVATVPSAPTNLSASSVSSTGAQLNWTDNSSNETGFRIERRTGSGSYSQIAQLASNVRTYSDNTLTASTTYTYRVYAYNSTGNSAYSNLASVTTPAVVASNIAPGKPSSQSTTSYGGVASRANDNNTNGTFSLGSVSNTGTNTNPYWQVDLQGTYSLTNIEIWNRTDACCISRLNNFYVFVSNTPFQSADPAIVATQSGVWSTFVTEYPDPSIAIPVNRSGRYVRVQIAGQAELTLAEVKIFGSLLKIAPEEITSVAEVSGSMKLSVYPNPSKGDMNIKFVLPEHAEGTLCVFDMTGRIVHTIAEGSFTQGENTFRWNVGESGSNIVPGVYLIKITAGGLTNIQKVLLTK